jgi:pimeloyl-ACP methyl ester carboxylesterase
VFVRTHDGLALEGRVTMSHRHRPGAGVLLLHGSGPTDMDQTVPASLTSTGRTERPLKDLAVRLAREGFVVMRYNKRGVSTDPRENDARIMAATTVTHLLRDARAALATLRALKLCDPHRIVLVGHSEGTVIASLLALDDPRLAGVACLAPMARTLEAVLRYQLVDRVIEWARLIVDRDRDGRFSPGEVAAQPRYGLDVRAMDTDGDGSIGTDELERRLEDDWEKFRCERVPASPWLSEHFALEPNAVRFRRLGIPVQIFHGEEDAQTPLTEALLLSAALADRPSGRPEMHTFPGLGHGFSPPLAPDRPTVAPIAPEVLDSVARALRSAYLEPRTRPEGAAAP